METRLRGRKDKDEDELPLKQNCDSPRKGNHDKELPSTSTTPPVPDSPVKSISSRRGGSASPVKGRNDMDREEVTSKDKFDSPIQSIATSTLSLSPSRQSPGQSGISAHCFACGETSIGSKEQPRRRYLQQTTIFKERLMTSKFRKKLSAPVYKDFTANEESCAACLARIKEVWALHQEISSIQEEMDKLLGMGRENLLTWLSKKEAEEQEKEMAKLPPRKRKILADTGGDSRTTRSRSPRSTTAFDMNVKYEPASDTEIDSHDPEYILPDDDEVPPRSIGSSRPSRQSKTNAAKKWRMLSKSTIKKGDEEDDDKHTEDDDDDFSIPTSPKKRRTKSDKKIKKTKSEDGSGSDNDRDEKPRKARRKAHSEFSLSSSCNQPCTKCGKVLTRLSNRIHHEISVCKVVYTDEELEKMGLSFQKCKTCDLGFVNEPDLRRHEQTHTGIKPYTCSKCGKSFTQPTSLKLHETKICPQADIDPEVRRQHYEKAKVNNKNRTHKCPHCRKRFASSDKLSDHVTKAHESNPDWKLKEYTVCDICGKSITVTTLRNHMRQVHNKERRHSCSYCGKGFFHLSDMKKHINAIHEKVPCPTPRVPKYICDICPKAYAEARMLRRHKETVHMGITRYQCEICAYKFYMKHDYLRHLKTHNKPEYKCAKCGEVFDTHNGLYMHENRRKTDCVIASKKGGRGRGSIRRAKKRGLVTCQICGDVAKGRYRWKLHMQRVHPDVVVENDCKKEEEDDEGATSESESEGEVVQEQIDEHTTTTVIILTPDKSSAVLECEVVSEMF